MSMKTTLPLLALISMLGSPSLGVSAVDLSHCSPPLPMVEPEKCDYDCMVNIKKTIAEYEPINLDRIQGIKLTPIPVELRYDFHYEGVNLDEKRGGPVKAFYGQRGSNKFYCMEFAQQIWCLPAFEAPKAGNQDSVLATDSVMALSNKQGDCDSLSWSAEKPLDPTLVENVSVPRDFVRQTKSVEYFLPTSPGAEEEPLKLKPAIQNTAASKSSKTPLIFSAWAANTAL